MPRKGRKPKKHQKPESKTKNEGVSSTGISSSRQDESNSAAPPNEEPNTALERHENVISDVPSHFSDISEESKSSDKDISRLQSGGSSASFLEEVKEIDNSNRDTTESNASIKEDVIGGTKQFTAEASRSEKTIHQESISDDDALSLGSAAEDGEKSKEAMKDDRDSTFQVDLNSRSDSRSCPTNQAEGGIAALGPVSTSSLEAVSTYSQFKHNNKGRSKKTLKHMSEVSVNEHESKRVKSTSDPSLEISMEEDKEKSREERAVSEPSSKAKAKPLSKKKSGNSPGTSSKSDRNVDSDNYGTGVPHQEMSATRRSSTCDIEEQSKSSLKVSQRKRKSTEYVASGSSESVSEEIPPKRMQRRSGSSGSSTREKKSSPRGKSTSPRSLRKRQNKSENKSNTDSTPPKPCRTVTTFTESMTEYVGDAAFIAVGETPPRQRTAESASPESHKKASKSSKNKQEFEANGRIITTETESVREYLILSDDSLTDELSIQPRISTSPEVPTERAENLHTESSPDRNLNVAGKPIEALTAECSPTISSSESIESDSNTKQKSPVTYRGARPKTRGKESSHDRNLHVADKPTEALKAERSPTISSSESIESDSNTKQDSPVTYRGARPKTRGTESSPDRNLHIADKPTEALKAERSPTISSSESIESDSNTKQESPVIYRGARAKTRGKNVKEISPQKRHGHGDILTDRFPESSTETDRSHELLSKKEVKRKDDCSKQSSSTNYRREGPKSCLKKTKIFSQTVGDGERSDLTPASAENQRSSGLLPSFEEFKETLGVDKVEVVDINFDVFDKALGIDRSTDHSAPEHRQHFKVISPERLSEAMNRDNDKSMNNPTVAKGPQSFEMVEQNYLPTIEEFRRTLRNFEIPELYEDASEILNKALEQMESEKQNLQSKKVVRFLIPKKEVPSTSEAKKSPERQTHTVTSKQRPNRDPVPGILAFSGYRRRTSPIGVAVPDCFDLKAIANALDEILRSEIENTAGEIQNDPPRQSEVIEDSEESIDDINRAIAESGMKLKRSQVISSSDDDNSTAKESEPVEITLHSSTQVVSYEVHRDISETSQSSNESSEVCKPNSSEYREVSSESLVESSESDEK